MMKQLFAKRTAIVLALALLLTSFASVMPVNAASTADMKKANVKWDLRNNKTIKFKTKWRVLGVKQHTVKMTNFKVKDAKKKGYKQCTFTLTYNRKINPSKKQAKKMYNSLEEYGAFGGDFYFAVVDYQTGQNLENDNDMGVTVTSNSWKHTDKKRIYYAKKDYIWYAKKSTVKVKIVYPADYKGLAIGVGGHPNFKSCDGFWYLGKSFSKSTGLYSKKDKKYAHFMRVK